MESYKTLLALIALIFTASILMYFYTLFKRSSDIKAKIKLSWGKAPEDKYKTEDFESISSYYSNKKGLIGKKLFIDDITWNDLDFDKVFMRLNKSHTSMGEEYLYCLLREPVFDEEVLDKRGRLLDLFRENSADRQKLQYVLELLGKQRHANISNFLTDFSYMELRNAVVYKILAALPLAALLLFFIDIKYGLAVLLTSFITNLLLYYKTKAELEAQLVSIGYVSRFVNISRKIIKLDIDGIDEYKELIRQAYEKLKGIGRKAYNLVSFSNDPFTEYVKIAFLVELRSYDSILNTLRKNREDFQKLYETVGLLDSMLSIASYRESLEYYIQPQLSAQRNEGDNSFEIKAGSIYHPLIKDPVANSIDIGRSVLLTGSNASGKSTFLKTLAINSIFAQTIYTCLATEYKANLVFTITSMAIRDNLVNNESYFIAEIKSLKRIFDMLDSGIPCICFIDEILRGTNTIERIAASSRVLSSLSQQNCICIAATHDIELTNILQDAYYNYHFREEVTDNDVVFDYKLYEGKAKSRNALKLLKLMGFDNEMVQEAEKAAYEFEHDGVWNPVT